MCYELFYENFYHDIFEFSSRTMLSDSMFLFAFFEPSSMDENRGKKPYSNIFLPLLLLFLFFFPFFLPSVQTLILMPGE